MCTAWCPVLQYIWLLQSVQHMLDQRWRYIWIVRPLIYLRASHRWVWNMGGKSGMTNWNTQRNTYCSHYDILPMITHSTVLRLNPGFHEVEFYSTNSHTERLKIYQKVISYTFQLLNFLPFQSSHKKGTLTWFKTQIHVSFHVHVVKLWRDWVVEHHTVFLSTKCKIQKQNRGKIMTYSLPECKRHTR